MEISKKKLFEMANQARQEHFEILNAALLQKMRQAAENGEYSIFVDLKELNSRFISWLFEEKFELYGLKAGYVDYYEPINHWYAIDAYKKIQIAWHKC